MGDNFGSALPGTDQFGSAGLGTKQARSSKAPELWSRRSPVRIRSSALRPAAEFTAMRADMGIHLLVRRRASLKPVSAFVEDLTWADVRRAREAFAGARRWWRLRPAPGCCLSLASLRLKR